MNADPFGFVALAVNSYVYVYYSYSLLFFKLRSH